MLCSALALHTLLHCTIPLCRKTTQRTIEELTISITDIESRLKGESTRARKKYESLVAELEAQLDSANKALAAAMKENKNFAQRTRVRLGSTRLAEHLLALLCSM